MRVEIISINKKGKTFHPDQKPDVLMREITDTPTILKYFVFFKHKKYWLVKSFNKVNKYVKKNVEKRDRYKHG